LWRKNNENPWDEKILTLGHLQEFSLAAYARIIIAGGKIKEK
jgi:hypothetical protein